MKKQNKIILKVFQYLIGFGIILAVLSNGIIRKRKTAGLLSRAVANVLTTEKKYR